MVVYWDEPVCEGVEDECVVGTRGVSNPEVHIAILFALRSLRFRWRISINHDHPSIKKFSWASSE